MVSSLHLIGYFTVLQSCRYGKPCRLIEAKWETMMANGTEQALGQDAHRLLERMAAGGVLSRGAAGWALEDGAVVAAADVSALERADLIARKGQRRRISGPGQAYLLRLAHGDWPNRIMEPAALGRDTRAAAMRGARLVNRAESPLAWLLRRDHLSLRQYEAGERLRADFEMAAQGPRVTMRWDASPTASGARGAPEMCDPTTAQIAAKQQLDRALKTAGRGLADVLTRVVCMGEGLETAERALGWPSRSGKLVLGFALDRVADHYHIK